MTSRLKLPFKLTDSKKSNEFEVNETSKKDDFSLSEVSHLFFFLLRSCQNRIKIDRSIRISLSSDDTRV